MNQLQEVMDRSAGPSNPEMDYIIATAVARTD